ncbi:unnamed protein product [Brassicogethes aeneus]|uniref:protein-tyrosine-phosphatase n=1 Tax=Brassicogethes aeneus TaxID=1431903 RepID=A0A9P0AZ44_BRAAE|nr:unnamed protein product [Brassicogethes aeneus]
MGFTLRFILGIFLTFQICTISNGAHIRIARETKEKISTTLQNVDPTGTNLPDLQFGRKINVKESKPKTEKTNVNTNDTHTERKVTLNDLENVPKNLTTVKLEKSESYRKTVTPSPTHVENVIKNYTKEEENTERESNGRSIDVDVDKYVSPEFHDINNVFTLPISADTEKYIDPDYDHETESNYKFTLELTTPKSDYFDSKYKETVASIDQKLEHLDTDYEEGKETINLEKLLEKSKSNKSDSDISYEKIKNVIDKNNSTKGHSHKDTVVEEGTKLVFESSYNHTDITEPNEKLNKINQQSTKENSKETNAVSKEFSPEITTETTRKTETLTKPPSNRNISYILNNKIETDSIKKTNLFPSTITAEEDEHKTTSAPIAITKRGSIKFAHTTQAITPTVSPQRTTIRNKITEQNKSNEQENQVEEDQTVTESVITEVRVPIDNNKNTTKETTTSESTTIPGETTKEVKTTDSVVTDNNETIGPKKPKPNAKMIQDSTVVITTTDSLDSTESTTTDILETTRILNDTPSDSTTGKTENTTEAIESIDITTEINTTTETTTENVKTTEKGTTVENATTENVSTTEAAITDISVTEINLNNASVTDITITKVTTDIGRNKELNINNTTVTDIAITEIIPNITTDNVSTTDTDTTKVTTNIEKNKELIINNTTVTDIPITEIIPNITTETGNMINNVTEINVEYTTKSAKEIQSVMETITTSATSTTTMIPVKTTMIPEITTVPQTTTEKITVIKTGITAEGEKGTTSTTEIIIYHIENDTATPEVINPSYNYPTPDIVEPENRNFSNATVEDETTNSTESSIGDPEDNRGTIAAIVISSVGAICLILLAGLLIIMRKRQKKFNYGQRCTPVSLDDYSMDNVSVYNSVRRKAAARASKRSYGNPAFDDPTAVTHPLNFPALAKFSSNLEDIKAEFEEIPQIGARTSELPEGCETKNRYANVIPLPETRVFLNTIEGYANSDYINANYVTGPKNTKGYYIACQGPMANTVDDFWRMVWEQQSKVILMLTQLFENGVEKCVDYLPPSEVLDCHRLFGDFQVTLKKREVKDKYIISSIQLKNMVSNSWREVTHFWYLGWPEKGVPKESNSIIAFLIEARSYMKTTTIDKKNGVNGISNGSTHTDVSPVVVHCSPGTGRTGVVIACDIAIREFEKTRLVDIPKIVYRIRRDRASSVQTKEQYQFIYKVVSLYAAKLTGGALDEI